MPLTQNATVEDTTVKRLTANIATSFPKVIDRFRSLVPSINLGNLRAQTSPEGIAQVIRETGTATGFVLFSEFDHGRWIRYFPPFSTPEPHSNSTVNGPGAHRFIFGNPLFAITMIRESLEAALHVPLNCGFFEQEDGSTRMVMLLPDGLVAGHASERGNEELHQAAKELERKVFELIEAIQAPYV
ncbi:hypothetical protein ACJZ2D_016434 [Fusarium nematophilum]